MLEGRLSVGNEDAVPNPREKQEQRQAIEDKTPRITHAATIHHLKVASHHDEDALGNEGGKTIEDCAYKINKVVARSHLVEIQAVGRNVMEGTRE